MFELKKLLATLAMPLPALLIVGFFGLFLLWFTQRKRIGTFFVSISLLTLALISFQPLTSWFLIDLERQHARFIPTGKPIEYVMVLGHGHVVDDEIPPSSELSRTALMRLVEGIRIHLMYPSSKLILSGYDGGFEVSHARMLARVAMSLGVNSNNILLLETAKDTREEAEQAATVIDNQNVVLITSASHMSRALFEFNEVGLEPIPAPTNFIAQKEIHHPWIKYAPRALHIEQFEKFWHEKLGHVWQRIRRYLMGNNAITETVPVTQPEPLLETIPPSMPSSEPALDNTPDQKIEDNKGNTPNKHEDEKKQ